MKLIKSNQMWQINNSNTAARGDCLYLPCISKAPILDSTGDKNEYSKFLSEICHRSNLASGEPEQHQICLPTSSATFIVSSTSPSQINIQQEDENTNTSLVLFPSIDISSTVDRNEQQEIWFKQHWILVMFITGIIVIFITIVMTSIIL